MLPVLLGLAVVAAFAGFLYACGPEGSPRRRVKDGPYQRLARALAYLEILVGGEITPLVDRAVRAWESWVTEAERS